MSARLSACTCSGRGVRANTLSAPYKSLPSWRLGMAAGLSHRWSMTFSTCNYNKHVQGPGRICVGTDAVKIALGACSDQDG